MQTIIKAFKLILSRKIFIIYIAAVVLLLSLINLMNPLPVLINGIFNEISGDYIETLVTLINQLFNKNTVLFYILASFAVCLAAGIILSLLFSGILYMLSKTVDNSEPAKTDFVKGFLNYFIRLAIVFFIILYSTLLLIFSFAMIIFPTLLVGKITGVGATGNGTYEFFAIVTAIVSYLLLLFLRVYLMYMIPACYKTITFYKTSLKVAGASFIKSVTAIILCDIIYLGLSRIIYGVNSEFLKFILSFVTNTFFWSVFIVWLFYQFNHTIIKKKISLE